MKNTIFILMLIIAITSCISTQAADVEGQAVDQPAALPEFVAGADTLMHNETTQPFGFDAYHVQGLFVTDDYYFFTSVFKVGAQAWIFKLDRETGEKIAEKNLAEVLDYHPGGIDFDGKYIWVPVAVYEEHSHTNMMVVRPEDLKARKAFEVDDHIGLVAIMGETVIGGNWDARQFYFWTRKGELLEKRESPTGVGYQDCKGVDRFLVCTGGGNLDWIDVEKWKLSKRFLLEKSINDNPLSREGVALHGEKVFFLPDDGAEGRIYIYGFASTPE